MKRLSSRFPVWARAFFSVALLVSLVSGVCWYCLGRWGEVQGEFGPEKHPWLGSLAKVHGAGAFVALISFGMILGGHVPAGWRTRLSRKSGGLTLGVVAVSILTAYGLYYNGSDEWREVLISTHLAAGLLLPWCILMHVRAGRHRLR